MNTYVESSRSCIVLVAEEKVLRAAFVEERVPATFTCSDAASRGGPVCHYVKSVRECIQEKAETLLTATLDSTRSITYGFAHLDQAARLDSSSAITPRAFVEKAKDSHYQFMKASFIAVCAFRDDTVHFAEAQTRSSTLPTA
ncbi:hypothetical protein Slin15195_G109330 [Septoria linicola]|uniref:Uncharacterized protein n=1 Tax=Septoria linicola TaxID=215465 RepID=A0A9Q9EPF2_9PEZI|nr:hypothetical protein Slin14017_G107690 [Septoria linicola]USW57614.1 hypothetical protein Slin15195_G109330 [Septoria linicola]